MYKIGATLFYVLTVISPLVAMEPATMAGASDSESRARSLSASGLSSASTALSDSGLSRQTVPNIEAGIQPDAADRHRRKCLCCSACRRNPITYEHITVEAGAQEHCCITCMSSADREFVVCKCRPEFTVPLLAAMTLYGFGMLLLGAQYVRVSW